MSLRAQTVLRISLGITFIWLGLQIWAEPLAWGSFMLPWAQQLLPQSLESFMQTTAVMDIILGIWMLIGWKLWVPALLATLHLLGILITTTGGIQLAIPRDVGLFGASLALLIDNLPPFLRKK